jgi:hypothetical protein
LGPWPPPATSSSPPWTLTAPCFTNWPSELSTTQTYSSRILHGSYTHTLYGTDDQLGTDHIDVATLRPRMVRTESTGDFYTLHHTMIHSVTAQPYTTSLIVRSPAVKDRFLVTDRITGQAWWQHGAATESPDETARKRMNVAHANTCLRQLTELRVLN